MKRSMLLIAMSILLVLSFGCATKDYVKQQIEPLMDRISKLEAMNQETMKTAKECCEKAEAAASKLEGAAERAETAAKQAEVAAEKAKKSFEMQLKK